jgi:hypothetical protein
MGDVVSLKKPPETNDSPDIDSIANQQIKRRQLTAMEWLERRTQPYIVWTMSISAAIRTVYVFTEHIVDLTKIGALNTFINAVTGIALALISDLTIVIAGRRRKLYNQHLFNAKLALASAKKSQLELWQVEVKRLEEQVNANNFAMWAAMIMSIYASASYLITSAGVTGALGMASASAIAGYTLYLAYFHAVQTDEIKEDGTAEVATAISEQLNFIRVEEIARIRNEFANGQTAMSIPARLALIAGGLSVPEQRRVMPTLGLLLRSGDVPIAEDEDDITSWYTVRSIAIMIRDAGKSTATLESIMRNVRRRLGDNAEKHPDQIRVLPGTGWMIEPEFALDFFDLPKPANSNEDENLDNRVIVDAD